MKRAALVLLSAVLVACGGDDDDGGGGGAGGQVNAGTHSFTARDSGGLAGTVNCDVGGFTASTSFAAVTMSDASGVCSLLEQSQEPANASALTVLIQRVNIAGESAPPITARTYQVTPDIFEPEDDDNTITVVVSLIRNDGTCNDVSGDGAVAESGTVRIDAISGSRIRGSVNVTFVDGSEVTASFDAPVCSGLSLQDACDADQPTSCRQ